VHAYGAPPRYEPSGGYSVGRWGKPFGRTAGRFCLATVQSDKTACHCFSTEAALENGIATFVEPVPFDAWAVTQPRRIENLSNSEQTTTVEVYVRHARVRSYRFDTAWTRDISGIEAQT
jgi:hypothetical protein